MWGGHTPGLESVGSRVGGGGLVRLRVKHKQ